MLAKMFTGQRTPDKDKDGNYFIDRNGKHFDHILDFLRDDKYLPPHDVIEEVLKDAKYFGLYEYVYRLQPLHICEPIWTFEYA